MGVVFNPAGEYAKEVRKWEQSHTQYSMTTEGNSEPGNPYVFRPYPRMVYKAFTKAGKHVCMEPAPHPYAYRSPGEFEMAILQNDSFNRSCQLIVGNDDEYDKAQGQGWRDDPLKAVAHLEALDQDMGNAAAEAAAAARGMTATAQREHADAEASTHEHVVDVVGQKQGQKPVAVTTAKR